MPETVVGSANSRMKLCSTKVGHTAKMFTYLNIAVSHETLCATHFFSMDEESKQGDSHFVDVARNGNRDISMIVESECNDPKKKRKKKRNQENATSVNDQSDRFPRLFPRELARTDGKFGRQGGNRSNVCS